MSNEVEWLSMAVEWRSGVNGLSVRRALVFALNSGRSVLEAGEGEKWRTDTGETGYGKQDTGYRIQEGTGRLERLEFQSWELSVGGIGMGGRCGRLTAIER